MRIISGKFRGKKLHALKGITTRPTSDRVREAIFNILSTKILNTRVLDLFAGTGALSLEAISRGAKSCVMIDSNPSALSVIHKNIVGLKANKYTETICWDIRKNLNCLSRFSTSFDLVFMDPPYNNAFITPTLTHLSRSGILKNEAIIVIEHHPKELLEQPILNYKPMDQRRYGKTLVSFLLYMV